MERNARPFASFENPLAVELRTNRWNPFSKSYGHLIDFSNDEFKIHLQSPAKIKIGKKIRLKIYLLNSKEKCIKLSAIVKWIDETSQKTGGIFIKKKKMQELEQQVLCHFLSKNGHSY